jgi:hypothetical protein
MTDLSNLVIGTQFEVNFDQELSDQYNEIVHFHFEDECPVCHTKHAGTDQYCSVNECVIGDKGIFSCDSCETKFKILQYDFDNDPEALIEVL